MDDGIKTAREGCEVAEREAAKVDDAISETQAELRKLDSLAELSPKDLLATENARRRCRALEVTRAEAGKAVEKARRALERVQRQHYLDVVQSEQARVRELDAAVGAAVKAADAQIRTALDLLREAHSQCNASRLNAMEPHVQPEGWAAVAPDLKPWSVFAAVAKRLESAQPSVEEQHAYAISLARMAAETARMRLGLLKLDAAKKAAAAAGPLTPFRPDDRDEVVTNA